LISFLYDQPTIPAYAIDESIAVDYTLAQTLLFVDHSILCSDHETHNCLIIYHLIAYHSIYTSYSYCDIDNYFLNLLHHYNLVCCALALHIHSVSIVSHVTTPTWLYHWWTVHLLACTQLWGNDRKILLDCRVFSVRARNLNFIYVA
jgi:hypothetical protein